jgi:tetratricopeptide (TPR) repeat protein
MELCIASSNATICLGPVKALLQAIDYIPQHKAEYVGFRALMPYHPASAALLSPIRTAEVTDYHAEARYFTKGRIVRSFVSVIRGLLEQTGPLRLTITNYEHIDEASLLFFERMSFCSPESEIRFVFGMPAGCTPILFTPTPQEAQIEHGVTMPSPLPMAVHESLMQAAKVAILSGDLWTSERILKRLQTDSTGPEIASLLGLIYMLQARTLEAEFYYEQWRTTARPDERAYAHYALAMLYARHHPAPLRSIQRAASYLEAGYELLQSLSSADVPDFTLKRVTNRNGHALVLFRTGRVDEAIALLQQEMVRLTADHACTPRHKAQTLANIAHNLAQCYHRQGRLEEAIQSYQALLDLDESLLDQHRLIYHLDLARCHIERSDYASAMTILEQARSLDPALPEIYALLGFCWQELGELQQSRDYYRQVWLLEPSYSSGAYAYAYALSELGQYQECLHVLAQIDLKSTPSPLQEDIFSLYAEAYLNVGDKDNAHNMLQQGLAYIPASEKLQTNVELIAATNEGQPLLAPESM